MPLKAQIPISTVTRAPRKPQMDQVRACFTLPVCVLVSSICERAAINAALTLAFSRSPLRLLGDSSISMMKPIAGTVAM